MGSNVPPMIPTRPPATERAYPGPPEPVPEDRPRLTDPAAVPARRPAPARTAATGSPVQPVAVRTAPLRMDGPVPRTAPAPR